MRSLALVAATCALCAGTAAADSLPELETRGQQLAREGRFVEAIATFKAADQITPRASHACLIALAYTRRELWSQAEIFLALCHARATADDPLPDWVPTAEAQLASRLATASVALVQIDVTPDVPARIAIAGFPSDEVLATRTVHLGFGHQEIIVAADGYVTAHVPLEIADQERKVIAVALQPEVKPDVKPEVKPDVRPEPKPTTPPDPVTPPPVKRPPPEHVSRGPYVMMATGGALALLGLGVHVFALTPTRMDLQNAHDANDPAAYARESGTFDHERIATVALYGAGAAAVITGAIWRAATTHEAPVQLSARPVAGGAVLGIAWSR